ncbi:sulfatase-like hydrolase/transferase [Bacteroidota bacterium]
MRKLIVPLLLILTFLYNCGEKQAEDKLPNIILILADDLGYGDLDCYGNTMNDTPNLDKMASEGLVFSDFHSNCPVCSPTRAALLSGKYQQRVGIESVVHATKFRHTGLNPDTYTLANYTKSLGYHTGIIGKWHLGYDTAFSPTNYGFDYFRGYVSGNVDYHSHIDGAGYYDWWEQKDTLTEAGYSTDLITKNAVNFIQNHKDEPFFLYVAHEAPHSPYQGRLDPPERTVGGKFKMQGSPENLQATYREMIAAMDDGVGEIYKTLEQYRLFDNTIVIFLSDNGANKNGSNALLRGYKGSLWEGGHRIPAIVVWRGRIKQGISDELLLGMDIFPTLAALIGEKPHDEIELDGIDFSSVLLEGETLPVRQAYWRYGGATSIRKGPWKLLHMKDSTYLFNLAKDPTEQVNVINENKTLSDSLSQLLMDWEAEMNTYKLNTYQ